MSRKVLTVHLLPELVEAAKAQAEREHRSFSRLVEVALKEYLERRGAMPRHITYYIPGKVGGQDVYLRLSGPDAEIVPAEAVEVDPFSRVTAPPLREGWADDLGLTEDERVAFEEAEIAYTRATVNC